MALEFIRKRTDSILSKVNANIEDSPLDKSQKCTFYPYAFLEKYAKQHVVLLKSITSVNRNMIFVYFLDLIQESMQDCNDANPLMVSQLRKLFVVMALIESCFCDIETKEDFIPDEKKSILFDLWLLINEETFGCNVSLVKKCYTEMLISVSKHSQTFFDGLTKTLHTIFQNRTSYDFWTIIEPWISLCNNIQRLSAFLKVLTTNLTLVTSNFYPYILELICKIVMNTFSSSSEECKKHYEEDGTLMIANQVSDMINTWEMKPDSLKWNAQMCLLLTQPITIAAQVRDSSFPFLKGIIEVKEVKNDNDINVLSAILKGFSVIASFGPHPIINSFMIKFIDLPTTYYKEMLKKKNDEVPQSIHNALLIDFPVGLIFINVDLFVSTCVNSLMNTKVPSYWHAFGKAVSKICKITAEKQYSFRQHLNALIDPICKAIELTNDMPDVYKKCLIYAMSGFAENSLLSRLVFVSRPETYATMMDLMKNSIIGGIDKLNSSMFNMKYVDDNQGPNFWTMLSTTFDTYISLSKNTLYLLSMEYSQIPTLVQLATEFVKAMIKDGSDTPLPAKDDWNNMLLQLEYLILFALLRTEENVFVATKAVINNYLMLVDVGNASERPLVGTFIQISELEYRDYSINVAKIFRNDTVSTMVIDLYDNFYTLFTTSSHAIDPKIPINSETKTLNVNNIPKQCILSSWFSSMSLVYAFSKTLSKEQIRIIKYLLHDNTGLGKKATKIIANSVSYESYQILLHEIKKCAEDEFYMKSFKKLDARNIAFAQNVMRFLIIVLERNDWDEKLFDVMTTTRVFKLLAHFANVYSNTEVQTTFCHLSDLIINLSISFNEPLDPKERFVAAKNMLQWIPPNQQNDKNFSKAVLTSIKNILSCLSFFDTTDPIGDKAKAAENFLVFFTYIKECINYHTADPNDLLGVLTSIMKENFYLGINNCIAMGYDEDPKVRTAFLNGLTSFFSPEIYKMIVTTELKEDIIDILMGGDFCLVKFFAQKMPYNSTDEFGRQLIRAAAYKSREFEFFNAMIELELATTSVSTNDEEVSRTKLFRGNGTPSKVFSAYAHMVAHEWLCNTITPIINKVNAKCEQGLRFQIDQTRLSEGENIGKNRENFRIIFQELIDQFVMHIDDIPVGILKAAQLLYKSVVNQSQKVASQAIASFIFLRFICPTLHEPTKVGYTNAISEPVRICLVHLSSLLMIAAVHPKADQKRPHYAYFNDLVQIAYYKLQTSYERIASKRITDVPLVTSIDSTSVTTSLHMLIRPLIPALQNQIATMSPDDAFYQVAKKFIGMMNESGTTDIKKEDEFSSDLEYSNPILEKIINIQQLNHALLSTLKDVFYKTPFTTFRNESIYYLNLAAYTREYSADYLAYHFIRTIKLAENEKYVVIADCGDVNISFLPPAKDLKLLAPSVPENLINSLTHIYVVRLQSDLVPFIVESTILKRLPKPENIKSIDEFRISICAQTSVLKEHAVESLIEPDSVHSISCNGTKAECYICQRSIRITGKANIGSPIMTSDSIVIISILHVSECQNVDENNMQFKIVTATDKIYNFIVDKSSNLRKVIVEVRNRDSLVRTTRNFIYVEKPTLKMLLLNVAMLNLASDTSDYGTRQAALGLLQKVFDCTEINHTINIKDLVKEAYTGSVLPIVEELSEDIAINNNNDVHGIFQEFAKTIPYLNSIDYCVSSTFLCPWMKHCGIEAVKNKKTLDAIAQIIAMVPQTDFMQFNESFWGQVNDTSLYKTLLLQTSEFCNSSFISLFIPLSESSPELSKFVSNIIENEQTVPYFSQTLKITISCLINGTFDLSNIPSLLHGVTNSLYNGKSFSMTHLFSVLYRMYVGESEDLNDSLFRLQTQNMTDFQSAARQIRKIAKLINNLLDEIPDARDELIARIKQDTQSETELVSLGSFLILSIISDPEDSSITYSLLEHLYDTRISSLSFIAYALSERKLTEKFSYSLLCAGLFLLVYTGEHIVIEIILSALKQVARFSDLNNLDLTKYVSQGTIDYLEQVMMISFEKPIDTILSLSVGFDKKSEIIFALNELGVKNELITIITTKEGYEKSIFKDSDKQAMCSFVLKRLVSNPDDSFSLSALTDLAINYPTAFASFSLEKIRGVVEKGKTINTIDCLVKLVKLKSALTQDAETGNPYYAMALDDQSFLFQVAPECATQVLNMLFK